MNGVLGGANAELLQKWDDRARRLHTRMEILGEGLTLGAGTVGSRTGL
jgi:hypothetical protein